MIKNDSNTRKSGNKEYQIGLSRLIGGITMKGLFFEKLNASVIVLILMVMFSGCTEKPTVIQDRYNENNERIKKTLDELNDIYGPATTIQFDENAEQTEEFKQMIEQMSDSELYEYLESLYIVNDSETESEKTDQQ